MSRGGHLTEKGESVCIYVYEYSRRATMGERKSKEKSELGARKIKKDRE